MSLESTVSQLRLAAESGSYSGLVKTEADAAYFQRCTGHVPLPQYDVAARLIFTRDTGHHSSGWWKNPDYERCYHLSLSLWDFASIIHGKPEPVPFRQKIGAKLARAFFPYDADKLWVEPPYSDEGRRIGVHHYRLFCDASWCPLLPRGEVYTRDFTEKGWKSFSEIHGEAARGFAHAMDGTLGERT